MTWSVVKYNDIVGTALDIEANLLDVQHILFDAKILAQKRVDNNKKTGAAGGIEANLTRPEVIALEIIGPDSAQVTGLGVPDSRKFYGEEGDEEGVPASGDVKPSLQNAMPADVKRVYKVSIVPKSVALAQRNDGRSTSSAPSLQRPAPFTQLPPPSFSKLGGVRSSNTASKSGAKRPHSVENSSTSQSFK